jgi:hypothetical protein
LFVWANPRIPFVARMSGTHRTRLVLGRQRVYCMLLGCPSCLTLKYADCTVDNPEPAPRRVYARLPSSQRKAQEKFINRQKHLKTRYQVGNSRCAQDPRGERKNWQNQWFRLEVTWPAQPYGWCPRISRLRESCENESCEPNHSAKAR